MFMCLEYAERLLELQNISKSIINEENKFAQAIKNTYEATETAYITVHKNLQNNENKEEVENKNKAIEKYLKNQMSISTLRSTIPVKYEEIEFFYVINNYELYIDPTEEIFYRKEVITQEISALKKAIHSLKSKECPLLNESAFYEVTFLNIMANKPLSCLLQHPERITFMADSNHDHLDYINYMGEFNNMFVVLPNKDDECMKYEEMKILVDFLSSSSGP
ncbi:hypothetical protein AGLY_010378 [Aphis glycines]|uniref:Uncharacterized protein n=1 Tax=Aphis glycines TaxID=307491 RepID=A0A6G0TFT6_APHGL|nr:hypothetical protein AGLY_010378 [Aphis glycines]